MTDPLRYPPASSWDQALDDTERPFIEETFDPADFPGFNDTQIRAGLTTPACEEKKP
jgi:hypothetical protein